MVVEGVVLLIAPEGGDMRRSPPLGFESVSNVPLVSSSSLKHKSSSAKEGGANVAAPIGTATSCKCKLKQLFVFYDFL